jgi:hypothetical protein
MVGTRVETKMPFGIFVKMRKFADCSEIPEFGFRNKRLNIFSPTKMQKQKGSTTKVNWPMRSKYLVICPVRLVPSNRVTSSGFLHKT